MKKIFLVMSIFLFIAGCEKQNTSTENDLTELSAKSKSAKVDVCHNGKIININGNAVSAHQRHGDAVDMDGDGLFDIDNDCSATDCDDNDAGDCDNEQGTAELLVGTWTPTDINIKASVGAQSVPDYLVNEVGLSPEDTAAQYELLQDEFETQITEELIFNADNTYSSYFNGAYDYGRWSLSADEKILTLFEGPIPDIIIIAINSISEDTWDATTGGDFLRDLDNNPATIKVLVSVEGNVIFMKD
ncbi:MAG: hypothetical protein WBN63_14095 [Eudoraea sp.]|uniref:hypothetical protein n=1 Tax=Eudoraea sp. TaxID=1979955 RepID=UPI003C739DD8